MGDTGHGNFENDAAADFASEVLDDLMSKIDTIAKSQHGMDPDESTCREMVAAIDLLHLIAKHTGVCLPEHQRIQKWKDSFFDAWDEFFELSPEYRNAKRIKVVRGTFDKAIAHCAQFDAFDFDESED